MEAGVSPPHDRSARVMSPQVLAVFRERRDERNRQALGRLHCVLVEGPVSATVAPPPRVRSTDKKRPALN
jgi:hypothetical protein